MIRTLLLLTLAFNTALALAVEPKEGRDYDKIEPAPPVGSGDQVEVLEFFMYTCPHCKNLDPSLQEWRKKLPGNVQFHHVPAMFGGVANLHAKTFYALEVLGEEGKVHQAFFDAIHEQKKRLRTPQEIEAFLAGQGVDVDRFREAMNSFAVQTKTNRAAALMRRYGIRAVPTLVVDGRYRIKNTPQVLEVTDALIEKTLAERKGK